MMPALYPLRLQPQFMERIWGSDSLAPLYERTFPKPVGEVWLTGDDCKVANGPLAGESVAQLAKRFGTELIGEAAPQPERFPLLVKFIFPREKLSVQVHPDDETARGAGLPCGKTECWYVLAAEPGAQVALGLKRGVTRAQLREAIQGKTAENLLNWVNVQAGEMIYVDAGTVHTIGPGVVLLETQQNSDTTYRLYDYGRSRELHVEQGLAATKEQTGSGKVSPSGQNGNLNLVTSPCFVVHRRQLKQNKEQIVTRHMPPSSVQIVVGLKGKASISANGQTAELLPGEAVAIPASASQFSIRPEADLDYIHVALPQEKVPHPETVMK
jgi:mannose-6-phosphate isomerase